MSAERVADLSEDQLIDRIRARLGAAVEGEVWSGDDAALVGGLDPVLITTDTLVEGVDFELSWVSGADLGWKLVASNVSDIAAMGGRPARAVVTVQTPTQLPLAMFDGILDGIVAASDRWGVALVGGDISGAGELSLAMTVLGTPIGEAPILRSGAQPSDVLCVTGTLGGSAAGLAALTRGLVERRVVDAEIADRTGADALSVLAVRHLRPNARADEAAILARGHVHAMIDISDGLARDLARLLRASGAGCQLRAEDIPVHPEIARAADRLEIDGLEAALTGGEEYELLVALDADVVEDVQVALDDVGTPLTVIGSVTGGEALIDGEPLETWEARGWDHLQNR